MLRDLDFSEEIDLSDEAWLQRNTAPAHSVMPMPVSHGPGANSD